MYPQIVAGIKSFFTNTAGMPSMCGMRFPVLLQNVRRRECSFANIALEISDASVDAHVIGQRWLLEKRSLAKGAFEPFDPGVGCLVNGQIRQRGVAFITFIAMEWLEYVLVIPNGMFVQQMVAQFSVSRKGLCTNNTMFLFSRCWRGCGIVRWARITFLGLIWCCVWIDLFCRKTCVDDLWMEIGEKEWQSVWIPELG